MNYGIKGRLAFTILLLSLLGALAHAAEERPRVLMETSLGAVEIELYAREAPKTVANFLAYVDAGYFDGLIFHRVIPGFMIQGGGFKSGMQKQSAGASIKNEADNGLKNDKYTLAMARTADPHSASSQFFVNVGDNEFLNFRAKDQRGWGYAVFGRVIKGMDVVDRISGVPTGKMGPYGDVPKTDVLIVRAMRIQKSG